LGGGEGNHGEDVKESYFYIDNMPTHSYMRMLYKYPIAAFPYDELKKINHDRGQKEEEYEIYDCPFFLKKEYFDIEIIYAKNDAEDICIQVSAVNCSDQEAVLHILPTLWFRNVWSFGEGKKEMDLKKIDHSVICATYPDFGPYYLHLPEDGEIVFTENESNNKVLFGSENSSCHTKDSFHRYVIGKEKNAIKKEQGTKAAGLYAWTVKPKEKVTLQARLTDQKEASLKDVSKIIEKRKKECDQFYTELLKENVTEDQRVVQRQAFAGLLWNKQFYHFVVQRWLDGDPNLPKPPKERYEGRNATWTHLYNDDVLSIPDSWEYPWFAAWDSAFHTIPVALIDPHLAKRQLTLLTREWYLHPNGQMPAYEWNFSDVNPPVHAWAGWRVYKIEQRWYGVADHHFLASLFKSFFSTSHGGSIVRT
jgi:hypothetical protein